MSDHAAALAKASTLSDDQLVGAVRELIRADRTLTAQLLVHLGEVDARRLYLEHACSSMHVYCVERLHMSDPEAYRRIHAARIARRYPRILDMVAANKLHLTAIAQLAPHLNDSNCDQVLDRAVHKTKREIEILTAELSPEPDVPQIVRRLPLPAPLPQTAMAAAPEPTERVTPPGSPPRTSRPVVAPTAPERYKIQFAASAELHDKLRQAQELLRHQVPDGDIAEIFEKALDGLIETTKKKRFAATSRPRKVAAKPTPADAESGRSRHIPSAIKRAVVERDEGRCTYEDAKGNRCGETAFLQFHHIDSFAGGGEHSVGNITLRCAGHNRYAAELELGRYRVEEEIRRAREERACGTLSGQSSPPALSGQGWGALPGASPPVEQLALVGGRDQSVSPE